MNNDNKKRTALFEHCKDKNKYYTNKKKDNYL